MSNIDTHVTDGLSRRSVVKGAAWAMPAVVVAPPAPLVAASTGALSFPGRACKLPGNSTHTYKGYVFELSASSTGSTINTVTVVTGVTLNGVPQPRYALSARGGACTCSTCGSAPTNHQFCTPSGSTAQRVLLYTDSAANSAG